jgi:hypothetical protein
MWCFGWGGGLGGNKCDFFFFSVLEFALRTLHLLGRRFTTWAMSPVLFFAFGYFSRYSLMFLPWLASDCEFPTYALHVSWVTVVHCHTQLVGWDGFSLTFLPYLTLNWSSCGLRLLWSIVNSEWRQCGINYNRSPQSLGMVSSERLSGDADFQGSSHSSGHS